MSRSQSPRVGEHQSVLALPAVDYLLTDPDGTYVDATFGRGGHSRLILERLGQNGKLVAFDRDPQAVDAAGRSPILVFTSSTRRFHAASHARRLVHHASKRSLLDLGMSSPQIDDPSRGFSWRADGPLDMRMDPSRGETAAEWLAHASFEELAQVIRDYGEERFAASIAKAIVARRAEAKAGAAGPLSTTADLAGLVANAVGRSRKDASQHPATRTFQAVRIHVNRELEELALALDQAAAMLSAGGRLVAISFHSPKTASSNALSMRTIIRSVSATQHGAYLCVPISFHVRRSQRSRACIRTRSKWPPIRALAAR